MKNQSIKTLLIHSIYLGLLAFPLTPAEVSAQFFHDYIDTADSLMEAGDFQQAADNYAFAFNRRTPERNKYYYAASRAHALSGDSDSAFHFLEKTIAIRWFDLDSLVRDSAFFSLHDLPKWEETLQLLEDSKQAFEKGINKELQEELLEIKAADQWMRIYFSRNIQPYYEYRSPEIRRFWDVAGYLDSLKSSRLDTLIAEHGWPHISLVDEEANKAAWLIAMHSDLEKLKKYFPLLEASCKDGESFWSYYAYLRDRIMIKEGKKVSICVTSFYYDEEQDMYFGNAEDKTKVNLIRERMGVKPSEGYRKDDVLD